MNQKKWWLPLGLILSAGFIWAGVSILLKIPASEQMITPPPGWQIIRPPYDVHAMTELGDIIWAGGKDGLFRIDRRSGELIEEVVHDPPFAYVRALLADGENHSLWVGHQTGLSYYKDGLWTTYNQEDGLPDNRVNALMIDDDGNLWVGTWGGVAIQNGDGWHTLTQADGLLDNMVNVMLQDQQGGIWFGSYVAPRGGISYWKDGDWQYFNTDNGLPHNNITSLIETNNGNIWAGVGLADRGGAVQFLRSGAEWQIVQVIHKWDGLAGEKVRSIFQDSNGVIWFGSEYDGTALLYGDTWLTLDMTDGLSHPEIKTILQDVDGNIWLGTRDGLTRISDGSLMALYDEISSLSGHP